MTVLILGGGISGLSTAFYLTKQLPAKAVTLWEASERTGGWIKSFKNKNGIIFEQAARTLRPRSETGINTLKLIEELEISNEIKSVSLSSPAAKNRLIYAEENLHSLPSSILSLFKTTAPFTQPLIKCLINEHKIPCKKIKDESIYDFIERRLGSEVADYLISPLICGICAGNAKEVSVHFLASKLFDYEQNYGSITKGLLYNLLAKEEEHASALYERVKRERWSVYSFKNGLETLPLKIKAVIEGKGVGIHLNTKCEKLEFTRNEIIVHNQHDSVKSDHIFSSIQSEDLAKLLRHQHDKLSNLLDQIKSVDVIVVNLHYKGNIIKEPAFGFLVPPKNNLPILGVIFDSCCFEQNGDTVLTVMMGGYWFKKYFSNFTNEKLYDIALWNLKKIMNIDVVPVSHKVTILEKCIPQYTIGQKETVVKINDYILKNSLPLSICGMSYNGVGVNDVILSARKSVESFLKSDLY